MAGSCKVAVDCSTHVGVGGLVPLAAVPQAVGGLPAPHREPTPAHVILATGGIPQAVGGFFTRHCEWPPIHMVLAAGGIP